jgi:hypothetical protein
MAKHGDDRTGNLVCSFCGKSQDEVRKLIAGPTVYICDECIDLCNDIIAEEWEEEKSRESRVVRGGSFNADRDFARCAFRIRLDPGGRNPIVGFRVCVVPHPTSGI